LKDFELLLKNHDWYYNFSDDFVAWRKGDKQRRAIEESIRGMSTVEKQEARMLWNSYAPSMCPFPEK